MDKIKCDCMVQTKQEKIKKNYHKCEHEFKEAQQVNHMKMSVKFCNKCNYYEFAYMEELQKNIEILSGYNGE